jgi:hypothetical protein
MNVVQVPIPEQLRNSLKALDTQIRDATHSIKTKEIERDIASKKLWLMIFNAIPECADKECRYDIDTMRLWFGRDIREVIECSDQVMDD